MAEERIQRRLAAILAADVVGYSRIMEADQAGTVARLKTLRGEVLEPLTARFAGRIFKTMGDGVLAEFSSAHDALQSAVEIQRQLAKRNAELAEAERIELRIGVSLGDVIVEGDDLYGNGVNVAARLEGLAEPGGICISGNVYEHVHANADVEFEDLGEQRVKNIERPIRAWRVRADMPRAKAAGSPQSRLPVNPSIAVLPFTNMSREPEQDYFADGITEDIITALCQFPDLFVIARNSSFTYKGRSVRAQEIGAELGVRYVVQGSVRKAGERVRVNVQLIEAETGNHAWAERYDRKLVDIFDVQDELAKAIVAALPRRIGTAEEKRLKRKPPNNMAAYDYLIAGKVHHHRVTEKDNAEALRLLRKAIELDPDFAEAYAWKACTLGQALQFGFAGNPEELENEAMAAVTRALSLDESNVECHRLLCEIYMERHDLDQAVAHGARAITMNPNDPRLVAQQGELMTWMGRPEEGAEWLRRAIRLDPHGMFSRVHLLGRALYGARQYADALEAYRQIAFPRCAHQAEMAASLGQMGRRGDAEKLGAAVLKQMPDFSSASYVASLPYANEADREHLAEGLRKAGLPP